MTRGAGTTGRAVKKPSRKAATPSRAPKTARSSAPSSRSIDDPQEQISCLRRERDEALEHLAATVQQQSATADVLKLISHSSFDLQAVLATLVQWAGKLCQAENVQIFLLDGDVYRLTADNGFYQSTSNM
jgi:hypothetical protein